MTTLVHDAIDSATLLDQAHAAFDRGDLHAAVHAFCAVLPLDESADAHYTLGLAYKYLGEWRASLRHNLRSVALHDGFDEASAWNTAIAATALGDWAQARRQWMRCGIQLPGTEGPIHGNFGIASIRLNPWGDSETLFGRRICPARAQLTNVPLPESGYRYGDIVLHDGAATGTRRAGDATVPVFNTLARLVRSDFRTHTAYVRCEAPADAEALTGACGPGVGGIEDWTQSISHYCLRCSAGLPHGDGDGDGDGDSDADGNGNGNGDDNSGDGNGNVRGDNRCTAAEPPQWDPMRTFGVAAQSRRSVDKLLRDWRAEAPGRRVENIESREHPTPMPEPGNVWWRLPDAHRQS